MTRNQLKNLWFSLPKQVNKKEMKVILLTSNKVKVITDVEGYYSSSSCEFTNSKNALEYALNKSKLLKDYEIVITK